MTKKTITLIESDSNEPEVTLELREGMQVEMIEIKSADGAGQPKPGRAALCGYSNACVALIEVGNSEDNGG